MIAKRLIGAITIKNDIGIQSFSYKKYLPLGDPEILVKNLDRWGVDEILLNVIDRGYANKGPNFELISKIKSIKINTPIIYAGGIDSLENAERLICEGVDRLVIEKILLEDYSEFEKIYKRIGSQSLILSMPLKFYNKKKLLYFNSITKKEENINRNFIKCIQDKLVSEIMLIDYENEGGADNFNIKMIDFFKKFDLDLICFGGIKTPKIVKRIIKNKKVSAIAIGNSLNYKEHSVQLLKEQLKNFHFRTPSYRILNDE